MCRYLHSNFFVFKQKTAYEMRISDWSSDVCSSDLDGSMSITLTFAQGTDPDVAQVQVQNKLSLATPQLPTEVQLQGIRVAKATKNFLVVVGFVSIDDSMDRTDISDYIVSHVQDLISRTAGVGDYPVFGSHYAMRLCLDPATPTPLQLNPDIRRDSA